LVKTIRTVRGPRHQIVARLGKLDGAEVQAGRGWKGGHYRWHQSQMGESEGSQKEGSAQQSGGEG
jgi:hypothetical protein